MAKRKVRFCRFFQSLVLFLLAVNLFAPAAVQGYMEEYLPYRTGKNTLNSLLLPYVLGVVDRARVELGPITLRVESPEAAQDKERLAKRVHIAYKGRELFAVNEDRSLAFIGPIYHFDFDGNGLEDILITGNRLAEGLRAWEDDVILLLQRRAAQFQILRYTTYAFDIKDFVDVDGDGKREVLHLSYFNKEEKEGVTLGFWVYNLYKFKGQDLVLDNSMHEKFPKFLQYTELPNETETDRLTPKEKEAFLKKIPKTIASEQTRKVPG